MANKLNKRNILILLALVVVIVLFLSWSKRCKSKEACPMCLAIVTTCEPWWKITLFNLTGYKIK